MKRSVAFIFYKICQIWKFSSSFVFDLGDQSTVSFSYDTNLIMKYTASSGGVTKESNIICQCGTTESFTFLEEKPTNTYVR